MIHISENQIAGLYRYPVKGLTAERLDSVVVAQNETFPFDRAYAIENGRGKFTPDAPAYLPKIAFLMLMRHEKLARLQATFNEETHNLKLRLDGKTVAHGRLNKKEGRAAIAGFFTGFMDEKELAGPLRVVHAAGHSFSDVAARCVHIINLASVRELEKVMGRTLNPLRFRANIYLDGIPPWEEFDWLDHDIQIDTVRVRVFKRTERCLATNVDPDTGKRDSTSIPDILSRHFGHTDMGIYARICENGLIRSRDPED